MALTNAQRQKAWRERRKRRLAELEAKVAKLERKASQTATTTATKPRRRTPKAKGRLRWAMLSP
jgi:hypothetical protein